MIRLHLLGPLQIDTPIPPSAGFRSKAQALFCYLALAHGPVPRTTLEQLFWPDADDGAANLNRELSHLRKILGKHLISKDGNVQISPLAGLWLDADAFDQLTRLDLDDRGSLAQVTRLYRGEFMSGMDLDGCPEFDTWLSTQRAFWHKKAVTALDKLVQRCADYSEALKFARLLAQADPFDEEVQRQIMRLCGRNKDWAAALKQYQAYRQYLHDEMGIEPAAETTQLAEQIQLARADPQPPLPTEINELIGRQEPLQHLTGLIQQRSPQLISLIGPGGAGKSRLALAAAWSETNRFLHVIDFLRNREMLLVLDGFEHLVDHGGLLAEIVEASPQLKLVVTSRTRLAVRGERVIEIGGLDYPTQPLSNSQERDAYPAVQLFLDIARSVRPSFMPTSSDLDAIGRICRRVDGLPLGIELAASIATDYSCEQIAENLTQKATFLDDWLRGVPPRQRGMQATFDYSWELLKPAERDLFLKLTVLRGPFTSEAARQVAGASQAELERLSQKFFVRLAGREHFEIHDLLRELGSAKLEADRTLWDQTHDAHSLYFLNFLADRQVDVAGARQSDLLQEINQQIANVRGAWEWAVA
jgi:DNA-binding SARP family transcriptional activator